MQKIISGILLVALLVLQILHIIIGESLPMSIAIITVCVLIIANVLWQLWGHFHGRNEKKN